jgi:hypothetical protein
MPQRWVRFPTLGGGGGCGAQASWSSGNGSRPMAMAIRYREPKGATCPQLSQANG